MGNFYTNFTLRGPSQQAVAALLAGRSAFVTPASNGCVVVFDEESDEQNQESISEFASCLSGEFHCPLLAVLNHDDDILWYQLYLDGELLDEYDSCPNYFDEAIDEDPSGPAGGDARMLCRAFGVDKAGEVEAILRKSSTDEDGYIFAFERHSDLATALGISLFGVGTGFRHISEQELPDGLDAALLVSTKDQDVPQSQQQFAPGYYKVALVAQVPNSPSKSAIPVGWMPALWADLQCSERDLSEEARRAIAHYREEFKRLGFVEVGFKKLRRVLNPKHRDNGGINFLARERNCFGQLIYNRSYLPTRDQEKEGVVISFTAVFQDEVLSSTNNPNAHLEAPPNHEVIRVATDNVALIYQRLAEHPRFASATAMRFAELEALQAWFDSYATATFEERVRRGLFVRMSNFEVAIARRRLPQPLREL